MAYSNNRVLQKQNVYNAYIPAATNSRQNVGVGSTALSILVMKKAATDNADQAIKIAQKLAGASLPETLKKVKDFAYGNFQYLADGRLQKIHTLQSAWANRETGIDCKSYSVLISQILQAQGINHYFRKIKQLNDGSRANGFEDQYSHVYIVVPKNQKTNSVKTGEYYIIDGVIPQAITFEPYFSAKSDQFVKAPIGGLRIVVTTAITIVVAAIKLCNVIADSLGGWPSVNGMILDLFGEHPRSDSGKIKALYNEAVEKGWWYPKTANHKNRAQASIQDLEQAVIAIGREIPIAQKKVKDNDDWVAARFVAVLTTMLAEIKAELDKRLIEETNAQNNSNTGFTQFNGGFSVINTSGNNASELFTLLTPKAVNTNPATNPLLINTDSLEQASTLPPAKIFTPSVEVSTTPTTSKASFGVTAIQGLMFLGAAIGLGSLLRAKKEIK